MEWWKTIKNLFDGYSLLADPDKQVPLDGDTTIPVDHSDWEVEAVQRGDAQLPSIRDLS